MGVNMIQTALILEDILEVNAWMKQMLLETFAGIRIQQVYSVKEANSHYCHNIMIWP